MRVQRDDAEKAAQAAERAQLQAAQAQERTRLQAFVITTQDKFAEDIAAFGEVLEEVRREIEGGGGGETFDPSFLRSTGLPALKMAKEKQRQARAAIFAGRYKEAADLFAEAYAVLEDACPAGNVSCAAGVG